MKNAIIVLVIAIILPLYVNILTFGEFHPCLELGLSAAFCVVVAGLIIGLVLPTYERNY